MRTRNLSKLSMDKIGKGDQSSNKGKLEMDDIFHILQNQRRRQVLQYLANQAEECTLRDLAEQIAAWENDIPIDQISSEERQRVYIALYQVHLPKLDEFGVIEYNQSRGTVQRTDRADQLDQYRLTSSPTPSSHSSCSKRKRGEVSEQAVRNLGAAIGIGAGVGFAGGKWGIRSLKFWAWMTGITVLTALGAHLSRVKSYSFYLLDLLYINN